MTSDEFIAWAIEQPKCRRRDELVAGDAVHRWPLNARPSDARVKSSVACAVDSHPALCLA